VFHLYRSNRVERLADSLSRLLATRPLADPTARERVVVHSRGMERWLSMRLASALGVCANVEFPFPEVLVREIVGIAAGRGARGPADADPWSVARLTWAVLRVLPHLLDDPAFAPVRSYLAGQSGTPAGATAPMPVDRREYQLARRIAVMLDSYANYRPEWIEGWETGGAAGSAEAAGSAGSGDAPRDAPRHTPRDAPGGPSDWQPRLWRALRDLLGPDHPAALVRRARDALLSDGPVPDVLPPRVCLFGVSTLPPSFVRILAALSRRADVHLFVLAPSQEWIADLARRRRDAADDPALAGNPLLVSLGRIGAEFQQVLEDTFERVQVPISYGEHADDGQAEYPKPYESPEPYEDPEPYESPGTDTRLHLVQDDVLFNRRRYADGEFFPEDLRDRSLTFHACHSPLRQVEALRDELLDQFSRDPTLEPRDVVVMTPDVETYAPLVQAVFDDGDVPSGSGAASSPSFAGSPALAGFPRLPFRVADRTPRSRNLAADALSRILAMATGRMPASEVLDLLSLDPVRRRFGVDAADLPAIHGFVAAGGARWGIDADHRAHWMAVESDQNTWSFALDRLLLGVAMPGRGERTFGGVLPHDEVEGGAARVLGRFARFCETLFAAKARIAGDGRPSPAGAPRTLAAWRDLARDLLDAFVSLPPRLESMRRDVGKAFDDIAAEAAGAGLDREADLDAIRALIDERLGEAASAAGLLTGGINVCALVPMRSIPFRVVCLLGMDDRAFPRMSRRPAFDHMADERDRRPGDRSPRDDDRYLFLEALLSARDRVIVLWTGRDIRDNAPIPPAVPVGELLDVVAGSFVLPGRDLDEKRRSLVTEHPLQGFSPRCFDAAAPLSFDARALAGARGLAGPRRDRAPFLDGPLSPIASGDARDGLTVSVDELVRFLQHPVKALLRDRLGLGLEDEDARVEDREPARLAGLDAWRVGDAMLASLLRDSDPEAVRRLPRLQGTAPLGAPGDREIAAIMEDALDLRARVAAARSGRRVDCRVDLDVGGVRVVGTIPDLWTEGMHRARFSKVRGRAWIDAWVHLLAACASGAEFSGRVTVHGRAGGGTDEATLDWGGLAAGERRDRALAALADVVGLWRDGMRRPLPLFERASFAFADSLLAGAHAGDLDAAFRDARRAWRSNEASGYAGDDSDAWVSFLVRDDDPLRPGFVMPGSAPGDASGFAETALRVWGPILAAREGRIDGDAPRATGAA